MQTTEIRYNWTTDEALNLMRSPLDELCARAEQLHQRHAAQDIQQCALLSIKTGGCPEDCAYCSQSAHYEADLAREDLLPVGKVYEAAKNAKENGANRFCMGAAWREIPEGDRFNQLLEMVEKVASLGMEVCCTTGMAKEEQLEKMKEAGLTAYNHNLDTSREFYPKIITTRTYEDRIDTLKAVRKSGLQICSGGIMGMGESDRDRCAMLVDLANLEPHPESVPINLLVPIEGTPLEQKPELEFEAFLRTIAVARILMPQSRVRLSAGRNTLSEKQQLKCFKAGANSIFVGDKLLTAPNVKKEHDDYLRKNLEITWQTATQP